MDDTDRQLVEDGLLTAREASRLPQWAKRKILRLQEELVLARTEVDAARTVAPQSPWWLAQRGTGTAVQVGTGDHAVEVRLPDERAYTLKLRALPDGGVQVDGDGSLNIDVLSSNRINVHPPLR